MLRSHGIMIMADHAGGVRAVRDGDGDIERLGALRVQPVGQKHTLCMVARKEAEAERDGGQLFRIGLEMTC